MTDEVTATLANATQVAALWRGITADLGALDDPLAKALGVAVDAAAASAPRRSGRLAGSGAVIAAGRNVARVTNTAPYAGYVHNGTRYVRARPWMAQALTSTEPRWSAQVAAELQTRLDARAAAT